MNHVTNIQPRIENLTIIPVRFDGDVSKTVFAIKVPRAKSGWPHMSKDNKYYRRYNFQSVPMEEYEVRRAYNTEAFSNLDLKNYQVANPEVEDDKVTVTIRINVINLGPNICEKYKVSCWFYNLGALGVACDNSLFRTFDDQGIKISSIGVQPIFNDEVITALEFKIFSPISKINQIAESLEIRLVIFANGIFVDKILDTNGILEDILSLLNEEK